MQVKVQLQPGYILHRRPYRDSSLLLEAFTRDFGRIGLVARGARRSKTPHNGRLEPFQPLLLSWSGKGELWTLTAAEVAGVADKITGAALLSAFYLNELLMRLLQRHIPHSELYFSYTRVLEQLAMDERFEWHLRLFERDLLQELGYGLLLCHLADSSEEIQPGQRYCYHLERGPVPYGGPYDSALELSGHTLQALASGKEPDERGLVESKRLMRAALALYLGDKPLASRELFRQRYAAKPSLEKEQQV